MEEKQIEIISGAFDVFKRIGIRSVSMDDLAKELRVSKKTIYVYYKNKEALVADVLNFFLVEEDHMRSIIEDGGNAIDQLIAVAEKVTSRFKNINQSFLFDLEKYYPELSNKYFEKKTQQIYTRVADNIKLGINEGLYRDDLNVELVSTLYTDRMREFRTICDSDSLKDFSLSEIICQMIEGHIRGIASEKGLEYFETVKHKCDKIRNNDK